jgi:hypothetical protein
MFSLSTIDEATLNEHQRKHNPTPPEEKHHLLTPVTPGIKHRHLKSK